jgi:dimethylargininase
MSLFDYNAAIVRRPGASVISGLRSGAGADPDHAGLCAEHEAYVSALEAAGVSVEILPALEGFADSVFVEDPALVFPEGAILLRPGAESRLGEAEALAPILRRRFDRVLALSEGFADGGDVLVTKDRVFIGLSARTDAAGAAALAGLLAKLGYRAEIGQTPAGTLHFKTGSALLDEETIVATPALAVSGIFRDFRVLRVPEGEEAAANLLRINDVVLVGADFPRTIELLAERGLDVVPLPVAEIRKIDAGLSCMSLRWNDPKSPLANY